MEAISKPLKIYFLPFMAMGHMIPLIEIARLFASRGIHVTIITTPSNAKSFKKLIDHDTTILGYTIQFHIINFPSKQVGLPEGLENMASAADGDTAGKICTAADLLRSQVEPFVEANPPHVMVTDMMFTWSDQLTRRLGIPRFSFNATSIFVYSVIDAVKRNPQVLSEESGADQSPFIVPGLPHPITLNVKPSLGFAQMTEEMIERENKSSGIIVDSFPEIEQEYAEHYEKITGCKVWHVGPASLKNNNHTIMDEDKHECLAWLNQQQPKSVVYISFGSLCRFSDEQLFEIACGMEASRHKFLWVVHRKEDDDIDDNKWLPLGFEERMKKENKGIIVKGWAPQVLILNNEAIGGFMTQCGWNAMAETISVGVPMITIPGLADQYYNEKLITQVRGFGVEVGAQEFRYSPYEGTKKLVGRELIEKGVRRLMDGGEEATLVRRRVKELHEKAWNAVKDGGSSHRNLTTLIKHIKELVGQPYA